MRNALASPLLDQGSLLKDAQTVLVHLCGGENLTLFEIELLMQRLQKFVPEQAHVLFGAAVDPAMCDAISLTLISALPEGSLAMAPRDSLPAPAAEPPAEKPASQPVAVAEFVAVAKQEPPEACVDAAPDPQQPDEDRQLNTPGPGSAEGIQLPKKRAAGDTTWSIEQDQKSLLPDLAPIESFTPAPPPEPEAPKLKLGIKPITPQSELAFDSTPRGRFEGETPNVLDGEDLDLPPFLRKKK
ncbi:MAG: hypothetical protein NTV46_18725 [Verrucomicrobia bacterium]|nr:hypothetical protein [Verrucomicrobiota bacterium]